MNTHLRPVEAPEVIPERLGKMPIEEAINRARYGLGTIAIEAASSGGLSPYEEARLARIKALAEANEALLFAVLRANWIAEGRARLDARNDQGVER